MIFADKLIALRKKAGYSQEELAQQLNVTRQSVSKWEGAQSVPDIEKILQISKLFGVTTDYLLKDEMGEPEYAESEPTALRRVTLEQANAALTQAKVNAPYMAWGTALCVASPVMLLLLGEICQHSQFGLNKNVATGIGLCVLLVMVCVAVVLFMLCGTKNRDFDFLEKEPFETEYGVTGMVRERQAAYRPTYDKLNLTGTVLCILSAIPLFVFCWCWLPAAFLPLCWAGPITAQRKSCWKKGTTPATAKPPVSCVLPSAWCTGWWSRRHSCCTPLAPGATASPNTAGSSGPSAAFCMRP